MDAYSTILGECRAEFEVNRSRFIGSLAPCKGVDDGLEFVKKIRKEFSDSTHNCYAIIGLPGTSEGKFSDDGEPSGTAGMPIQNALKMNGLSGVVCVVTRYFGGVKLGTGGLVSAYTKATTDAIACSQRAEMIPAVRYSLVLSYAEYKNAKPLLSDPEIIIQDTEYSDNVKLTFSAPLAKEAWIKKFSQELTSGKSSPKELEKIHINLKR